MCRWLTNFSPALVPVAGGDNTEKSSDTEVQDYFNKSELEEEAATCSDDDK